MEAYMAAATQNPVTECTQRLKSDDIAQVKNDFRQNNAHLNQMSFIPVYSSKTVCHKFSKSNENQFENPPGKVLSTYSPPSRPRCITGNSDVASQFSKTHMRRRSVGFEDMTAFTCYGHNFTNDRFQGSVHNSNIPQPHTENHSIIFNPNSTLSLGKMNQSESSCFSSLNHNSQLSSGENANDKMHRRTERPLHRYKDKSSKRKSSLNRIDFIQFPSNAGNTHCYSDQSQHQNSSSDEGSESKLHIKKLESQTGTTKRKHISSHMLSKSGLKTNEITQSNNSPAKSKSNMLPRSSLISHLSPRANRWRHSSTIRFSQKLSHSAGELESLTDLSEVPSRNKTYLSAQEYDVPECSRISLDSNSMGAITRSSISNLPPQHLSKNGESSLSKNNICDSSSQVEIENKSEEEVELSKLSPSIDLTDYGDESQPADQKDISNGACFEQITMASTPSNSVCDDSREYTDAEIDANAIKLENLEITDESKNMDIYLSADESGEVSSSDGRRRPSILRKKSFEEKKELHSILKPPPDDKLSKTPPSILKHRESSEEKEVWQSNDLHSILKKSTSEEDSCNSGPDIRPILKLSTDEDSPSGSVRPRPILKKRTSFSDECSYVSFPSGELKPILKKKTPLSSEDQPKPILKCRRKSEDTRSTTSEVITSRPRAYSADMGVKLNHEGKTENSELKDFHKLDSHDL